MIKNFEVFLNEKNENLPIGLPKEVSESALIIAKNMYEKVKKISFFRNEDDFFVKFQISPIDFKFIDPNEVLPLELSDKSMKKRNYYVELSYDDEFLSTYEVVYKIFFENMSNEHLKSKKDDDEFIDEYEEELKQQRKEDSDYIDFDIDDLDIDDDF